MRRRLRVASKGIKKSGTHSSSLAKFPCLAVCRDHPHRKLQVWIRGSDPAVHKVRGGYGGPPRKSAHRRWIGLVRGRAHVSVASPRGRALLSLASSHNSARSLSTVSSPHRSGGNSAWLRHEFDQYCTSPYWSVQQPSYALCGGPGARARLHSGGCRANNSKALEAPGRTSRSRTSTGGLRAAMASRAA